MSSNNVQPAGANPRSKWMVLSVVMMGVIMGPIDASIVNVVLPSIATHFQTDYAVAQWVPTIYLLAVLFSLSMYPLESLRYCGAAG